MTRLPYDPCRSCLKCGHGMVSSKHVSFAYLALGDAIRRCCGRCGYTWDEIPLDSESRAREPEAVSPTRETGS